MEKPVYLWKSTVWCRHTFKTDWRQEQTFLWPPHGRSQTSPPVIAMFVSQSIKILQFVLNKLYSINYKVPDTKRTLLNMVMLSSVSCIGLHRFELKRTNYSNTISNTGFPRFHFWNTKWSPLFECVFNINRFAWPKTHKLPPKADIIPTVILDAF